MSDQPAIDPRQIAGHRLSMAAAAAERGQPEISETSALLSIAASLQQLCDQTDAALAGQDQMIALQAKTVELLERAAPQPVEGELLEASGCCQNTPTLDERMMNLLEFAFGIIANVDEKAGTHETPQWREAKREFVADYNRLLADIYQPNATALVVQARDEVARMREQLGERSAD